MIRVVTYLLSVIVNLGLVFSLCLSAFGDPVQFDCPATVDAHVLNYSASQKVIEVPITVSTSLFDSRYSIDELKIEVVWNRNAYPVVDYAPRTELTSRFDGPISVEQKTETNIGAGAKVSSSYVDFLTPSVNADINRKKSETRRFNEVAPFEVSMASGTLQRGTGAYFQYNQSSLNTLEGSRDLVVAFRVPVSWRGGILQITFSANGKQRKFGSLQSDFEFARVFVLPVYLEGDNQARQMADEFSQSEQQLRRGWSIHESSSRNSTGQFARWLGVVQEPVPSLWVHHLIQSGSDVAIEKYESRLPNRIAKAANQFVVARRNLVEIGR